MEMIDYEPEELTEYALSKAYEPLDESGPAPCSYFPLNRRETGFPIELLDPITLNSRAIRVEI